MVKVTSTTYTSKGHNKRNYKKKNNGRTYANKKGNGLITQLSNDRYHTELIKGYYIHSTDANGTSCISTIKCSPAITATIDGNANTNIFPQWAALQTKYDEFRCVYGSATVVFSQKDSVVMSVVERDATPIQSTLQMTKNTQFKTHALDEAKMEVFRGWKPSASADYDFQSTTVDANSKVPAYIKLLQTNLPAGTQKCQVVVTLKLQFRGLKNNA